jgi:hypothetical protein
VDRVTASASQSVRTRVTVSIGGRILVGTGRGCLGFSAASAKSRPWRALSRPSSTRTRGFESAPPSSAVRTTTSGPNPDSFQNAPACRDIRCHFDIERMGRTGLEPHPSDPDEAPGRGTVSATLGNISSQSFAIYPRRSPAADPRFRVRVRMTPFREKPKVRRPNPGVESSTPPVSIRSDVYARSAGDSRASS